jgi:simple sugar transport system substrate-binding protein
VSRLAAALAALAALLAACGETTVVREPPVRSGADAQPVEDVIAPVGASDGLRIAVITHGQASSPFWAIVRTGVEAAASEMDAVVAYQAPDVYSLERMRGLVEAAVRDKPDGLVVSLPERGLEPAIRRAARAGIPVVSINSGSDGFRRVGALAHVGQPEDRAGLAAGRRLAAAGVRRALCVNQQIGNQGLDARCAGLARAMRGVGGRSSVLGVDDQDPGTPRRIGAAVVRHDVDGVLTTNATTGLQAVEGVRALGRTGVRIAAFDLGPDVLDAVRAGRLLFAVDQQPYLQGYLPVVLLAQRARYGLFPSQGEVVATGPNFVTQSNAAQALELSRRSIR